MKYYLIAGEASGDLHGGNLIKHLKSVDTQAEFRFWGGDNMARYAGQPVKHYEQMAFMGFVRVATNIRTIKKNINFCREDLLAYRPDVLILIDFAGFNLQIASFAKQHNIKVFYYISPKIWAWKTNRIHKIKKYVDEMFTILPFETEFFKKYQYPVHYVGNPVVDAITKRPHQEQTFEEFQEQNHLDKKPIVALLPGSRKQEIKLMLSTMCSISEKFPEFQFVIAGAPGLPVDFYSEFLSAKNLPIVFGQTYQLLQHSKAALVTSGTATLETALLNVPQVVCYKTGAGTLLYKLGRKILKVPYISLVNLILGREAVPERIQDSFTAEVLEAELRKIAFESESREKMLSDYHELWAKIGESGASERAAGKMVDILSKKKEG